MPDRLIEIGWTLTLWVMVPVLTVFLVCWLVGRRKLRASLHDGRVTFNRPPKKGARVTVEYEVEVENR